MSVFERTKEEVAEKVRKLLAQAEDPAATAAEAQAFTEKAQQLMTKYAIDLAQITDPARTDEITAIGWVIPGPYANRKVTLVNAVARANDCRAIYSTLDHGRRYIEVIGYPTDVAWVETLSRSLDVQLAGALGAAAGAKPASVHGRTFAVGFVAGFIVEVSDRLQKARRAAVAAADAAREDERREAARLALDSGVALGAPAPSAALVLVAKARRVEEEFRVRHPRTRTVYQGNRLQSWSGFAPGRDAGRRANLARGAVGGRRALTA